MQKFRGVFSIDTSFFTPLDGTYSIERYSLMPCQFTQRNQISGCSNFIIQFEFEGWEKGDIKREGLISSFNRKKGTDEAKIFLAWLVCASRHWARLSSNITGPSKTYGPIITSLTEDFDEKVLDTVFHVDKKSGRGTFVKITRPDFSSDVRGSEGLKLPSDFPVLTQKLFSLENEVREKFLNACFSYQFALEMWGSYPTISLLSLVSAVESIMVDEFTSQFCEDAKRLCRLKSNVMKKFRMFFERNLAYPLPKELKRFLNDVYSKRRSTYVHRALLGQGSLRGPHFGISLFEDERKLDSEKRALEQLVNAALIEWLKKI